MTQQLWNDLNTLLTLLHFLKAVKLIEEEYKKHSNDAPSQILQLQIEKCQKHLNDNQNVFPPLKA